MFAPILIMCKVMRLFVKSILSVFFFHFCSIFRQKPRPSSRFLPFQAVSFETICTSSVCAKSCATLVSTTCDIGANLSQTSSVFSAAPAVLLAILTLLSATAPILPATNYMLISGHEIMIAKHDFLISCPETTVSRLAIILKRAAGAMALVSAQGVAYAGEIVITINRI